MLRTLGDLVLEDADFKRQKPLLLLAYLSLEGTQERRYIAELFWPNAAHALTSLSVALSQLRKVSSELIQADSTKVKAILKTDANHLLDALDEGQLKNISELYQGEFLAGLKLSLSEELEEWLFATREYIAARVRIALLRQAEQLMHASSKTEGYQEAKQLAEKAYLLNSANVLEPEELVRFHRLFEETQSPLRKRLREEAAEFDIDLNAQGRLEGKVETYTLPALGSQLIGRDPELLELRQLLEQTDCRLLTLLGFGGMGKTKLALHLAHEFASTALFQDGVYFVTLETATSLELVCSEIAAVVSLDLSAKETHLAQLQRYFEQKTCLLILDNFEHLTNLAGAINDLSLASRGLKMVVTSREKLHLSQEWIYELAGLSVPSQELSLQDALYYDAIQLFEQCAKRRSTQFVLTESNLGFVQEISKKLEGSPLAIELAAAWTSLLPIEELASEVNHGFDLLQNPLNDMPERHHSLKAAFEQSWRLLSDREQYVLASLSVFRGGFRRQAAREVLGVSLIDLRNLLDKSLLRVNEHGRYDRHPLIYQYSAEKFSSEDTLLKNHMQYFLAYFEEGQRRPSLPLLKEEFENIRFAWIAALQEKDESYLLTKVYSLTSTVDDLAAFHFGDELLEQALESFVSSKVSNELMGRTLIASGLLKTRLSEFTQAETRAKDGLELLEAAADFSGLTWAHYSLSLLYHFKGEQELAGQHCEWLLKQADQLPSSLLAKSYDRHGLIEQAKGNYKTARKSYQHALALHRKHNNQAEVVTALLHLGTLELNLGVFTGELEPHKAYLDYAQALYEESLLLAKEIGKQNEIPILLHNLANIAMKRGQHEEAIRLATDALGLVEQSGEKNRETGMLATLSWIALTSGMLTEAQDYLKRGLQLAYEISDKPSSLSNLVRLAELWYEQGYSQEAQYLAQYVAQHDSSLAWVVKRAKRLLEMWEGVALKVVPRDLSLDELLLEVIAQQLNAQSVSLAV